MKCNNCIYENCHDERGNKVVLTILCKRCALVEELIAALEASHKLYSDMNMEWRDYMGYEEAKHMDAVLSKGKDALALAAATTSVFAMPNL